VVGDLRINDGLLYFRGDTDANHGLGWFGPTRQFAGASPDGPVLWGNAGGALGTAPAGMQNVALSWDGAGNVAIGTPTAGMKVDVGDRIRLREGASGSAGLWLYQAVPAEDRGFVGMASDTSMGLYGTKGAGWGVQMDVTNGNLGLRTGATGNVATYLNGSGNFYGLFAYGASGYALYGAGRIGDYSIRTYVRQTNSTSTTSTTYVTMPGMSLSVTLPDGVSRWFQVDVIVNGVQAQGSNTIGAWFRLMVDGVQQDMTRHEFNNAGWELRGITMCRLLVLGAGTHTINVDWATTAGTLTCCWYGDSRQINVVEL
jgi:hypothetical protein